MVMGLPCLLLLLPLLCVGLVQKDPRYWLEVQELLVVQEGLCARVPCSFYHHELQQNIDFNVYWFKEGVNVKNNPPVATNNEQRAVSKDTQGRFSLLRDPQALNCSLSICDARSSDKGKYFFRVEQGNVKHSYLNSQLCIWVTALNQKPAIHVSEPLVSGRVGRLVCSLPGACKQMGIRFSWSGEMLKPHIAGSSQLILTPEPQDHGRNLSCQVTLLRTGETMERTIQLNVSYAPQNLTTHISFRAASELGSQNVRLHCRADSNPPAEITWLPRSPGKVTTTQNSATLELHMAKTQEDAEFTCQAQNYLGFQTVSVRVSVLWKLELLSAAVPGALGVAIALVLLSFCMCLITVTCIVRVRRKSVTTGSKPVASEDPAMDSVPWNLRKNHSLDTHPDQAAPASVDSQELHYASLSFHGTKPKESQHATVSGTTEYSEIRSSK